MCARLSRQEAFGLLGDVYITVEGGPGVAGEARAAVARGARVVPFVRTGGASGGMFDFPAEAARFARSCPPKAEGCDHEVGGRALKPSREGEGETLEGEGVGGAQSS